tara:strand:+ start:2705 stop:4810 length:2106 start_codon:yes stop_codon:yes gene_type:complete
MNHSEQASLSLRPLFAQDFYKVPVYQRNYDWGEPQIQQLVEDINDFANAEETSFYYIGSLVVHQKSDYFEVLDGQQRFTTLTLLMCYLKYRLPQLFKFYAKINLEFESRPKSEKILKKIYDVVSTTPAPQNKPTEALLELMNGISLKDFNPSIVSGFKIISRVVESSIEWEGDETSLTKFTQYLLEKVKMLRVNVPKNTDVTHYFEVMNNRGEQLEKHEIVKADLLSAVQDNEQDMVTIQKIWLACSDMSRYAQTRFSVVERKIIFGTSCEDFKYSNFNGLRDAISCEANGNLSNKSNTKSGITFTLDASLTLDDSLTLGQTLRVKNGSASNNDNEGREERFTSVIDFPNFLMQVLRLYVKKSSENELPALDDKAMITSFKQHIGDDAEKAKAFVFVLLKYRYLFDRFIVKREKTGDKGDDWSLKHYKLGENGSSYVSTFSRLDDSEADNGSCLMLLSAFHVSYPTNSRKNWLSAALYWLDQQDKPVSSEAYLWFLEELAKAFMLNRYLTGAPQDYLYFIYKIDQSSRDITVKSDAKVLANVDYAKDFLSYGPVRLFVFNYLDYLLWKEADIDIKRTVDNIDCKSVFRFSMNNSVEHFSPQTPKANEKLDSMTLHSFGNLCLLTNSDNSSLSNDGPEQKASILNLKRASMAPLSLKLELMMIKAAEWGDSSEKAKRIIEDHEKGMLKILVGNLDFTKLENR